LEQLAKNQDALLHAIQQLAGRLDRIEHNQPSHAADLPTNMMFSGKVQKLVSLASSYCSVRFVYYMMQQQYDMNKETKVCV
jgi:hypothetical protein